MRDVRSLTRGQLQQELFRLGKQFNAPSDDPDDVGHGGSPGEWLVERMDEIRTELRQRRKSR